MSAIQFHPIGYIYTPHKSLENMPIQPAGAKAVKGTIEILPEYADGLQDIEGFSHITLFYHLHKVKEYKLKVTPFMDTKEHGIFACKSPTRPNAMGMSTVKLLAVDGNVLHIEEVDMLDGTPLIDIKPYWPKFDSRENVRMGWLEKQPEIVPVEELISDARFV
ncbi:tRNA (N6-threonylcarbamoyladenosine(37)-N6)-methyltransferase TrmO [Plebeiibacterium sediminum]|uniref:tRNA (N6-threonylcarbamoyladenosine(37)-N6)-methyltransferase TrmO n=1 Tax=Plebeiibacterium sediminum TaxID=2992112 RepID=A0AAE3M598_9BACT|nr:tRNA (N6-threonylcarbamoyladenosine(37)-N6)-methyltransferase TrmO [Plebeiobacterium sediminum]MCW3787447.1 tRNA (N6-threonylcarbamoyladenosine(37)-N6)-methyltransferase TrmO [Plebeiobacterium sediminum]